MVGLYSPGGPKINRGFHLSVFQSFKRQQIIRDRSDASPHVRLLEQFEDFSFRLLQNLICLLPKRLGGFFCSQPIRLPLWN